LIVRPESGDGRRHNRLPLFLILLPVPKATLVNLEHTFTALGNRCKIAMTLTDLGVAVPNN